MTPKRWAVEEDPCMGRKGGHAVGSIDSLFGLCP